LSAFKLGGITKRTRRLDDGELGRVLRVVAPMKRPHAKAMRMLIWTLARLEQVCGMRWRNSIWTKPHGH